MLPGEASKSPTFIPTIFHACTGKEWFRSLVKPNRFFFSLAATDAVT